MGAYVELDVDVAPVVVLDVVHGELLGKELSDDEDVVVGAAGREGVAPEVDVGALVGDEVLGPGVEGLAAGVL